MNMSLSVVTLYWNSVVFPPTILSENIRVTGHRVVACGQLMCGQHTQSHASVHVESCSKLTVQSHCSLDGCKRPRANGRVASKAQARLKE